MIYKHSFLYRTCLILLILFSLYICFCKLGASSFYDLNEAYQVQLSKDFSNNISLNKAGNSVTFGRLYDPIPILLINLSFKLFGESELSARLFSALFGILTILLTFIFAKSLYKNNIVGLFSAFILVTSYQFIFNRGVRSADGYVIPTFFMLAFLFLLWKSRQNIKFFYFSAFPFGLLGLSIAYGLIFVLGFATIFSFRLLNGKFLSMKQWSIWLLILIIILAPWLIYLLISKQYLNYLNFYFSFIASIIIGIKILGLGFLQKFILWDKIDLVASYRYNPFIHWDVVKFGFYPWSIMLIPAFIFLLVRLFKGKEYSTADKLIISWILPISIMFMTITLFSRSWWTNILCPALAILVGKFVYDFVWNFRKYDFVAFFLSAWFISMLMIAQLLQVHQVGYYSVPWMDSGVIMQSLRYNVSNPILWVFCLTIIIFLIQIGAKKLQGKFINKYIFIRISAVLFFIVSLINIIYLVNNSQNKSEMNMIRNLINNNKAIDPGKKLVLYNLSLLGNKFRLTPERNERWSDYYYLNKINIPREVINEKLYLNYKLLGGNIKGSIFLMNRQDFKSIINLEQKEKMRINVIWFGNEYVLFG